MAVNKFEGIYEDILYIELAADEEMEEMQCVYLSQAGKVKKCGPDNTPLGWVAQKVTTTGVEQASPGGLVSKTAKVGDKVGVYMNGGIFNVSGVGTINAGDVLYASGGNVTATPTANGTKVAVALTAPDPVTGLIKIKSLI